MWLDENGRTDKAPYKEEDDDVDDVEVGECWKWGSTSRAAPLKSNALLVISTQRWNTAEEVGENEPPDLEEEKEEDEAATLYL
jgi:hypothetical protein